MVGSFAMYPLRADGESLSLRVLLAVISLSLCLFGELRESRELKAAGLTGLTSRAESKLVLVVLFSSSDKISPINTGRYHLYHNN